MASYDQHFRRLLDVISTCDNSQGAEEIPHNNRLLRNVRAAYSSSTAVAYTLFFMRFYILIYNVFLANILMILIQTSRVVLYANKQSFAMCSLRSTSINTEY